MAGVSELSSERNFTLHSGDAMPAVGLGLWKIDPAQAAGVVVDAAELGYRHFDSASDYGNEPATGEGLRKILSTGVCRREELWVTSKLWNTNHRPEHVRPALERSLRDLQLEYLDLYLIHFPIALEYVPLETRYPAGWFFDPDAASPRMHPVKVPIQETWRAMEAVQQAGLVRNIGVSNFGTSLLRDLLSYAETPPAVLQVELHPYLTQEKLVRFCHEQGVAVTGFSPLGAGSYLQLGMAEANESVLEEPVVQEIAERHGRTPAQVALRWGVERGTSIVPKSTRPERLRENLAIFDFELSAAEMDSISALNRNRRFNDPGVFCEAAFNTFFPIYE
ncbi:MAG TPA: aldo/keto reductase [Lacipirellula sp.]